MENNLITLLLLLSLFVACQQAPDQESLDQSNDFEKSSPVLEVAGTSFSVVVPANFEATIFSDTPLAKDFSAIEDLDSVPDLAALIQGIVEDDGGTILDEIRIGDKEAPYFDRDNAIFLDGEIPGFSFEFKPKEPRQYVLGLYSDAYGNFAWVVPNKISDDESPDIAYRFLVPLSGVLNASDSQLDAPLWDPSEVMIRPIAFDTPPSLEESQPGFEIILNRYRIQQVVFGGPNGWELNAKFDRTSFNLSLPSLLLVHGTNGTPKIAFDSLLLEESDQLSKKYGDRIFAFIHPSVRKTVKHNGDKLFEKLNDWGFEDLDIVTRSRGALVTRYLLEKKKDFFKKNKVNRVVMLAGPHFGTQSANEKKRFKTFWLNKKLRKLPKPPSKRSKKKSGIYMAAAHLTYWNEKGIRDKTGIVKGNREIAIPGILDQSTDSPFLKDLNSERRRKPVEVHYFGIVNTINVEPGNWSEREKERARKVARSLEKIFDKVDSDGIVPVKGAFGNYWEDSSNSQLKLPFDCTYHLNRSPQAHHINYMNFEEVRKAIVYFLTDKSGNCL